jgi:ribosome-binding protein aMBF1 (putative translation factor)
MPHQQPRAPKAARWRDVRAKAVKEGHLDEQAVAAHKRRLIAATTGYALAERRQAAGLTRAELAARLRVPESYIVRLEPGHPDALLLATVRAYLRALRGARDPHRPVRE